MHVVLDRSYKGNSPALQKQLRLELVLLNVALFLLRQEFSHDFKDLLCKLGSL